MRPTLLAATAALATVFLGSPAWAEKILFIGDGDSAVASAVSSLLTSAGNQVTVGPSVTSFTGAGLAGYNAVVMAPGETPLPINDVLPVGAEMPMSGQQALVNFVAAGGGLVTGGDMMSDFNVGVFSYKTLEPIMPFVPSPGATNNTSITFGVQTSNPIIDAHLPQNFTFSANNNGNSNLTEEYYEPNPNAKSFFTTNQWSPTFGNAAPSSGAVGWTYGLGNVFSISSPIDTTTLGNLNFAQLVSNAVNWTTQNQSGPPTIPPVWGANPPIDPAPIPEPATMMMWGVGLAGALAARLLWRKRDGRSQTPTFCPRALRDLDAADAFDR